MSQPGSLDVQLDGKIGKGANATKLKIRATGIAATGVLSAASVLGILLFADPMHSASAFMAALFAAFAAGAIFSGITFHGRLSDALKEKENYRLEMERATEAKRKCEEMLVKKRLSSAPPAPKRGGKK